MILDLQAFSWSNIQNNSSVEKSGYFNHSVGSGLKKGSMIVGSRKGVIWKFFCLFFKIFVFWYNLKRWDNKLEDSKKWSVINWNKYTKT